MISILYILAFVFVLSLVVVIHEGGHFYMARLCGVKVSTFSIGFGRELWGRVDKQGTRWKICAIPLGGYVQMLGDEDAASAKSSTKNVAKEDEKYTFMAQPLYKRALIIIAGPAMNYISAFLMLSAIIFALGELKIPPVVGGIAPDSPAEMAGLEMGDEFISINGEKVASYTDIIKIVRITAFEKPLEIVFNRGDVQKTVHLTPSYVNGAEYPMIGITASAKIEPISREVGILESFTLAGKSIYDMTAATLIYLKQVLFEGRSPKDMRGPLGIAEASGDALQGGALSLFMFIIQISVAIGFMNLLPIPMLDGGHLAFYAVEAVRGKPLSEKTQNMCIMVGVALLVSLLIYTFFLDIPRLVERIMG